MKNSLLTVIILLFGIMELQSQNSFEFVVSNPFTEWAFSSVEKNNGAFLTIGHRNSFEGQQSKAILIDYSTSQDTSIQYFQMEDTFNKLMFMIEKANGNNFFIGNYGIGDTVGGLYLWETTMDYETVLENHFQVPNPYVFLEVRNYIIDSDNNVIIVGRAYYPLDKTLYHHLYMAKVDMQGQLLAMNIPAPPYKSAGSFSMFEKQDNSGYLLIGGFSYTNQDAKEWIELDTELNITDDGLIDWENGGLDYSAIQLDNGNFIMESTHFDELSIGLFDEGFNLIKDTLFAGGGDFSPFQVKSIGYVSNDNIWIGAFNSDPYWQTGTEHYYLYLYDSNLNLKGMKAYGGDTRYFMMHLNTTNDGGCILTGIVPDYPGTLYTDIYINKVAPEDVVTHTEEIPCPYDMDVRIFPNPVVDLLNVVTTRRGLVFRLYSPEGALLQSIALSENRTMVNLGTLRAGFCFYTISENGYTIQSGKLIKK
ncbi:MAG: T9SS type A sorting domain-containing protein [Chlorobi bacterium]|nr:T9SS type A sorting domain-containing protein [Chlorobiota bacterium]